MALSYLPVDRDQQFLLPPSMRDWLPEGHLVWFVLAVVAKVDTSGLHARHPNDGVGRRAYDPDMLLALLIYAYCTGVRSSRQIERLCEVDVGFRVICANVAPDHTTIARFRQDQQNEAVRLFTDVLVLCAAAGLVSVGVVAVDGTKMGANASLKANRTRERIEAEIREMFADAERVDASEDRLFGDARGDELPADLADPRRRGARLDAALRELERARAARQAETEAARAAAETDAARRGAMVPGPARRGSEVARAEAALARARERAAAHRARVETAAAAKGRRPGGPQPAKGRKVAKLEQRLERARARAAQRTTEPAAKPTEPRVNTTDPESRVMKNAHGWLQGYNAQAAVNRHGLAVAADVTQDGNDVGQCEPMMAATQANLDAAGITEPIGTLLFDAGYLSERNLTVNGPDRLIATGKTWKLRREQPTSGPPPKDASPVEAMDHRLRTPDGSALYSQRQHTVEPVFGTTKEQRGYRRFSRRGLAAVRAEWQLIMAAHNVLKLFHYGTDRS